MKKFLLSASFCVLLSTNAWATEDHGIMPVKQAHSSHHVPASALSLDVSMDKSEIVELSENAASIIVGNPAHANVLMDTPRRLVVVPRAPGATHFTVLNQAGEVILQRHIIVAAPKQNYIRVRAATCGENNDDCQETQTYYCETKGMCHTIMQATDKGGTSGGNSDKADVSIEMSSDAAQLSGSGDAPQ